MSISGSCPSEIPAKPAHKPFFRRALALLTIAIGDFQ
jgi:hypothetical protein